MAMKIMTLTDAAVERINEIIEDSDKPVTGVRVGVKNAGCAGMAYTLSYIDAPVAGEPVLDEGTTRQLIHMMEAVVTPAGTGMQASIPGYRVAGKTGTAWKSNAGGYSTDRYMAVFGGVAPATSPRLAAVVIVDEPGAGLFYGGDVAAPVFSAVVGGALRLLAVAPDAPIGAPSEEMPATPLPAPPIEQPAPSALPRTPVQTATPAADGVMRR